MVGVGRARIAVIAMFVLNGGLLGIWASRVPAVRLSLDLTTAQLGLALLCFGAGAICAFPLAGRAVDRQGAARVTWALAWTAWPALAVIGLAFNLWTLGLALFVFGAILGALDVAMNSWGAEVERRTGLPFMSAFHAMFSLGAGIGALSGWIAASQGATPLVHFLIAGGLLAAACIWLARIEWPSERSHTAPGPLFALPRGRLALVGLIAFCASLGEGAMTDWGAIFLREVAGASEGTAALGYAVFSAAMVAIRLIGDQLSRLIGVVASARAGGVLSALGAVIAVLSGNLAGGLLGFALMGAGYAVVMPLAFSRAANDPVTSPGRALASVATLGYGGLLMGPPVLSMLAWASSLRASFMVMALLAVMIVLLAGVLTPANRRLPASP